MSDIFNEIDEELKQEKNLIWFKKYGPYLLSLAILIVLVVAGNEVYQGYRQSSKLSAAEDISVALTKGSQAEQLTQLEVLADTLPEGYQAFALLQALDRTDDRARQSELLSKIYNDQSQDLSLRQVARLKWAFLQYQTAPVEQIETVIGSLTNGNSSWRFLAQEVLAYAYLVDGQVDRAQILLTGLVEEEGTPETIRNRARSVVANFS